MVKSTARWVVFALSFIGAVAVVVHAQTGSPAARPGASASLDDLLTELKGLRAEINQSAGASIRTQLLTARLQLEEQRIFTAGRQITEVQSLLSTLRQETTERELQVKSLEDFRPESESQQEQFREIQRALPYQRAKLDEQKRRLQELRTQESDLFNVLNTEQNRWNAFNEQLDAIERSLPNPARR